MPSTFASHLTSRGASVLTAACLLLLASCGRDTTAPVVPETAVSATDGVAASATDNRPRLVVVTEPGGAAAGLAFTVQPIIELRNHGGNLVMANKTVTVSVEGATVALGGTTSVTLVKGVARFTNLSIPEAGTYSLLFTGDSFAPVRVTIIVAPSTVLLSVDVVGNGTVTSDPVGINCSTTCSNGFSANALVKLSAQSNDPTGWTFSGWSGADACTVTGLGTCEITMDAAKSVIATFSPNPSGPPVLSMSITGSGDIAADRDVVPPFDVPDVLCTAAQGSCTSVEALNTTVTLIAQPATGATFLGWGGACVDAGISLYCEVLMDQARTVTAEFSSLQQLARNNTTNLTSLTERPRAARSVGTQ